MDEVILWLRVLLSLGAVLALLWVIQRRVHRQGGTNKASPARPLQLIARQAVGQKASVVIIEADGQRILLAVTEQSISVISSAEAAMNREPAASGPVLAGQERRERRRERELRKGTEGSILSLKTWQDSAEVLRNGSRN